MHKINHTNESKLSSFILPNANIEDKESDLSGEASKIQGCRCDIS